MSGSLHDDIPEDPEDFFGPGCGCLAAILVSVVTIVVALRGVFELVYAIARWWYR